MMDMQGNTSPDFKLKQPERKEPPPDLKAVNATQPEEWEE
jgi:hypothetical protein